MTDQNAQIKFGEHRIKKVVFPGGYTKSLALLDIVEQLDQYGVWQDVREIWGCGVSSIIALLTAFGMSAQESKDEIAKINFADFITHDIPFWTVSLGITEINKVIDDLHFKTTISERLDILYKTLFLEGHKIFKHDAFSEYVKCTIASRTGNPNLTFYELHQATLDTESPLYDPRLKDIMLMGTIVDPKPPKLKFFNWRNSPNMPIWKAIRICMSFPGAFSAFKQKNVNTNTTETFIDGSFKEHFPIEHALAFATENDPILHVRPESKYDTIGIYIKEEDTKIINLFRQILSLPIQDSEMLNRHADKTITTDTLKVYNNNSYQKHNKKLDLEYLVKQWNLLQIYKNSTNQIFDIDIETIKKQYNDFDINFSGTEDEYRKKLIELFEYNEERKKTFISLADNRIYKNKEEIRIYYAMKNIKTVEKMIRRYEESTKNYKLLLEYAQEISAISALFQQMLCKYNTKTMQLAFDEFIDKIQAVYMLRNLKENFEKGIKEIQQDYLNNINNLPLEQKFKDNFRELFNIYIKNLQSEPKPASLPMPETKGLKQYIFELINKHREIDYEIGNFKQALSSLEKTCCENGLQILQLAG